MRLFHRAAIATKRREAEARESSATASKGVISPVVLSQRAWHPDPKYLDREWIIYHYPRQYRSRITAYDRFIYYRPAKGAQDDERSVYFGHGILGVPFEDFKRPDHSFVPIEWKEPFRHLVALRDAHDLFYETEEQQGPQFQSAARRISETAFYRILSAGGVSASPSVMPALTASSVVSLDFRLAASAPVDDLRAALVIPQGTGYVPSGSAAPDLMETAALQERARKDHQAVLELVRRSVERLGGSCFYNNNIDLFAKIGERRYLIEAKSLVDATSAVDRMRYGMGQLFDYGVRYRAQLEGAEPVLAFAVRPPAATSWIGTILEGNGVGFIAGEGGRIVPLNERATKITFAS